MQPSDVVWIILIAGPLAFEVFAAIWERRRGKDWTFTHLIKRLFRLESSTIGRAVFLMLWLSFSAWVVWHFLFEG